MKKEMSHAGIEPATHRLRVCCSTSWANGPFQGINEECLKEDSKRFIEKSIHKGYVEYQGNELDSILPPTSRIKGVRENKKQSVLGKIRQLVEVFIGI